jgi:hypothetical protein
MCVAAHDYCYQASPEVLLVSKKAKTGQVYQAETAAHHKVSSQQVH